MAHEEFLIHSCHNLNRKFHRYCYTQRLLVVLPCGRIGYHPCTKQALAGFKCTHYVHEKYAYLIHALRKVAWLLLPHGFFLLKHFGLF